MLTCWHEDPKSRPLFDNLAQRIENILGKEITKPFIAADGKLQLNSSEQRVDQNMATISMNANTFEDSSISEQNPIESSSMQKGYIEMNPITKTSETEDTRL